MHVLRDVIADVIDLIQTIFTEKEVFDALSELHGFMNYDAPGGHNNTMERTALSLYAKELTDLVWKLDSEKALPRVVVSSHLVSKIPVGKSGLRPSDVVPISTRMDSLEKVVEKLSLSLVTFTDKMAAGQPLQCNSFNVGVAGNVRKSQGADNGNVAGGAAPTVSLSVPTPSAPSWAEVMGSQGGAGAGPVQPVQAKVDSNGAGRGVGLGRGRLNSKRKAEDESPDGFQTVPPRRQPRKVNYGKSNTTLAGAEAAPIDIFIGNTNPLATPDMIKTVLINSALQLPEKLNLEVIEVKCLNNFERDANPRSKCWKVTVPFAQKEYMDKDELYPTGWAHRKFFPPKRNFQSNPNGQAAKRPNLDPIADLIAKGHGGTSETAGGQQSEENIVS